MRRRSEPKSKGSGVEVIPGRGPSTLKAYYFALIAASVPPRAPLPTLVQALRGRRGVELVDVNEELRRLLIRVPLQELPYVRQILLNSGCTGTVELKALVKGLEPREAVKCMLRGRAEEVMGRRLAFGVCPSGEACLFIERRAPKALIKFCRCPVSATLPYPTEVAPGLCTFGIDDEKLYAHVEAFRRCLESILACTRGEGKGVKA